MRFGPVIASFWLGILGMVSPVAAQWTAETIKMQPARTYPHAGISLAIPTGFTSYPQLTGQFQVMLATRVEGRQATQSISLAVYPAGAKTTPAQWLEILRRSLEKSLSVRRLSVEKNEPIVIAGQKGRAVQMTYTFRGIPTAAVSVCFPRDIASAVPAAPPVHLLYVLTLEVAQEHRGTLLRTFRAVTRTILLTDLKRPIDVPLDFENGAYLRDFARGYAVRLPVGWIGGQNEVGAFLEQADYTLGGQPCPAVQVVSRLVAPALSAEDCIRKAVASMEKQGATVEVLSKGPARLAGHDALQMVLRQTQPPATQPSQAAPTEPDEILEVHRLLRLDPNEENDEEFARTYALIVTGQRVTVEQLVALADQLAERFQIMSPREE